MNNHAYQYSKYDCIEEKIQRVQSKYKHPEFDGYAGEELLKEIVSAVLPLALARTWEKTMSFGGTTPWAGTERISQRAQVTLRKIQQDIKDLQDLGLLEVKVGVETTVNNDQIKSYRAEYKDFGKLYDLAHEYHEWRQSDLFLIYQPTYADCMRLREKHEIYMKMQEDRTILQDDPEMRDEITTAEELYHKLLKFHNYRRLLTQKLKTNTNDKSLGGAQTHNGCYLHKTKNSDLVSAPYESILNSNRDSLDSNLTQDKFSITQDSPFTRRDEGDVPHDERGTHEGFTMGSGKGNRKQDPVSIPDQQRNNLPSEAEPNSQRNGPQYAKELTEQQKGKALIEAVLNEEDRKANIPKQERRERYMESKALQERCKGVVNVMRDIAHELNDQGGKSTDTRISKLFERSQMPEDKFIELMYYARGKVKSIPQDQIKVRGMDGKANRVPLLMSIVGQTIEKGMEAMLQADAEFEASREERREEQERKAQQDAELDAREQALAQTENDPEIWNNLYQAAVQSCAMRDEIEAGMKAVEPEPVRHATVAQVQQWAQDDHEQACKDAKEIIQQIVPDHTHILISKIKRCSCGCSIVVRRGMAMECVVCQPQPKWSGAIHGKIKLIAADMPSLERCRELVMQECQANGWQIVGEAV